MQRIRGELGLTTLPVIALTTDVLSSERQRATVAGMDDYIIKPFDARMLVTTILRSVTSVSAQAPAACNPCRASNATNAGSSRHDANRGSAATLQKVESLSRAACSSAW